MTHKEWKVWYRQYRIILRETAKARLDVMIYGSGYVMITNEPDYIQHIPLQDVVIKWPTST